MTEDATPQFQAPPAPADGGDAPARDGVEGKTETFGAEYVDKLRKEAARYRTEAKANADAAKRLAEIEDAQKTEAQKAAEETARWQSEAETWRSNAVGATVKALAATDFADPDDAVRNLDAGKYLDAGGVIDEKAIKADLAALLDAKPHYRRSEGTPGPRTPRPNPAQGSGIDGKSAPDPAQQFASILQGHMA